MYGFLYTSINSKTKEQRMYFFLFVFRRFALIMLCFEFASMPGMQVLLLSLVNLFFLIFTAHTQPIKQRHDRNMDMVSEGFMMLVTYHLLLFTEYGPDVEQQYSLGWSYLASISGLLLCNMYFVVGQIIYELKLKIIKRWKIY